MMLAGFAVLGGAYYFISVPLPKELPAAQVSTIYYADGKTVLAKIGAQNRTYVKLDKIPKSMQQAVVAAEDRTFYSNSGISIKGIVRAAWNNVSGGDTQGASTITQQYVRNIEDLTRSQSYARKAREAAMAVKLERKYSKEQIMEFYLNTIYLGRGAYGVEAAAQQYFGKSIEKVTVEESALLAGVIKAPEGTTGFDPASNPDGAKARWQWVMQGMADMKFIDRAMLETAKFPKVKAQSAATGANYGLDQPTGQVVKYIKKELEAVGIKEKDLLTGGYRITTTIDKRLQDAARRAVLDALKSESKKLAGAIVAVQPGTGRVMAYYGGEDGSGWDNAGITGAHQPGSSFKIYALAAAVDQDISVKSHWDSSSPQTFPDRPSNRPVKNAGNDCAKCKSLSLEDATVRSLNTTFYALARKIGRENIIRIARDSGIRDMKTDGGDMIDLTTTSPEAASNNFGNEVSFGQYQVSVLDHANGFATFAAKGTQTDAHFVVSASRTEDGDAVQVYQAKPKHKQAFKETTAADVDYVLKRVVTSSNASLEDGRDVAGKTGTWQFQDTERNAHGWMGGYTPELAAAAWVGNKGKEEGIILNDGGDLYGAGPPATIWKAFMNEAMRGTTPGQFPTPGFGGKTDGGTAVSPPPSASPRPGRPGWPTSPGLPTEPSDTPTDPSPTEPTNTFPTRTRRP